MAVYFDAGAQEIWLCETSGAMRFFGPRAPQGLAVSEICPQFPQQIELR